VAGEQHLLGITAHNINHLATLSSPIDNSTTSTGNEKFKDKLALIMAGKINPAMVQNKKKNTDREQS
jgi:flagellar protein FliO/FliZ